jgi:tetratricopeptide (TPR) repeat protein
VLEEELRATPADPSIRCLSGVIKFIAGEFENALAEFERAIDLAPDFMDPHYRLVDLCTKTHQLAPLQKRYEKLVADQPFRATARLALALVYSRTDQMDRAIQEALQAVRLAPREELPLRVLAETQILKARSLLRSDWDGTWSVFQDCVTTLYQLTSLESEQRGQWLAFAAKTFEDFAMESYRSNPPIMARMDSRELSILAHAACFYRRAQEKDQTRSSERDLSRITRLMVTLASPDEMSLTAGQLIADEQIEQALILLTLSLEQNPDQAEAYYQLAQLTYRVGGRENLSAALGYVRRALQADPKNQIYLEAELFFQRAIKEFPGGSGEDNRNE